MKKQIFKADISDADIIYLFLVDPIVNKLWDKIKKETRPGTVVVVLSGTIFYKDHFQKIPTQPGNKDTTFFTLYRI